MNGTPAVSHARTHERSVRRGVRIVLSLLLAATLLGVALPQIVSVTFNDVLTALSLVTVPEAIGLTALWALGLLTFSFVLTGALDGLSQRRALTLNLTGSAVSNTLPFGGAAGMSLNYLMIRTWGFGGQEFSAFTVITNVWGILLKLALPALALGAIFLTGGPVSPALRWSALAAAGVLVVVLLLLVGVLARRSVALRVVPLSARLVVRAGHLIRRRGDADVVAAHLLEFRERVAEMVGRRWPQLSVSMVGYGVMQALLLWACLHAVGATLSPVSVLAAFAVDRVASMVVLTPGGTGFAEAGAAATLVALGGAPAAVAAGVLLYRGFTFALEIPVGGVWTLGWFWVRRRRIDRLGEGAGTTHDSHQPARELAQVAAGVRVPVAEEATR